MTGTQIDTIVSQCLPRFQEVSNSNGKLVKWQQESQFVLQALQKNESLRSCYIPSIENAVINIAACGLTLNPADGYAYLVPEYSNALKQNECMLRISFKGLIKAATDSGCIKFVKAEVVKVNDTFKYNGPTTAPTHEMDPFTERGDAIGVYCIAKTSDGDILADVMSWQEVIKIKGAAKTKMVWDKWPEEMAKKAIIKRASKQWPKSKESSALHETINTLNVSEGSDPLQEISETGMELLEHLANDDMLGFGQIWDELTESEISTLWTAKTKGGWFDTAQKEKIREWVSEYKKILNHEEQS